MDIVITYVNGQDPVWQQEYSAATGTPVLEKRFRDWGTLPYLLRAIEKNIPFVRNVYLVVSGESQVPEWVNRDKVRIVLHKDIIPEKFLPVFNSTAIEMFLHRIPGLDEEYVYFNDDIFPLRQCTHGTFFRDGKAVIGMSRQILRGGNMFRRHVWRSDMLARKAAGVGKSLFCLRPQHCCLTFLKSSCERMSDLSEGEIEASVTTLRNADNFNVYTFSDYIHHTGKSVNERMSKRHISLGAASVGTLRSYLMAPDTDFVCINDVQMSQERFLSLRSAILGCFSQMFPEKSVYEIL